MAVFDQSLKDQDFQRLESCKKSMEHLIEGAGIPEWRGFSDTSKTVCVRGGSGQVHVGDVLRGIFPTLQYLRSKNMRVVVASTPGLDAIFYDWKDTIKLLDAGQDPHALTSEFLREGVTSYIRWPELLRSWKKELSDTFNEQSGAIVRSNILRPPTDTATQLREEYSENGKKKVLGIIWRTSMIGRDPNRNCSLEEFSSLINHAADEWNVVSLQYGSMDITKNEIDSFDDGKNRIIFDERINPMTDYANAGAQIVACDHIVSIDCSQIFQAGAFGVPVSILLSQQRKFDYWSEFEMGEEGICPFFPETARAFTQQAQGDWTLPLQRAHAHALQDTDRRGIWGHPGGDTIKNSLNLDAA